MLRLTKGLPLSRGHWSLLRHYTTAKPSFSTVDKAEVQKFSDKAAEWWDPSGEFSMLQLLNPPRVSYVRDQLVGSNSEAALSGKPFDGLRMLDIGCGGGLLSEVKERGGTYGEFFIKR
jgi:2-polyprenyl-6-hydroxyphenyl methylase/3-demethylubiquinone-9 3-methyltransferase